MGNLIVVKKADFSQVAVEQVRMTPEAIEWTVQDKYCAIPTVDIVVGTTVWNFEDSLRDSSTGMNCAILQCNKGDYFKVIGSGTTIPIAFVNKDNIVLKFLHSGTSEGEQLVEAPEGSVKVMLQSLETAYKL
jgi:hypothetical protein